MPDANGILMRSPRPNSQPRSNKSENENSEDIEMKSPIPECRLRKSQSRKLTVPTKKDGL